MLGEQPSTSATSLTGRRWVLWGTRTGWGGNWPSRVDALIHQRKQQAMNYKAYLAKIVELTKKVAGPETQASYPSSINSAALRALFDNLEDTQASTGSTPDAKEATAVAVHGEL